MVDICCIGHITLDKIITGGNEIFMAGGTSFYFSHAIRQMDVSYQLVTALGESEMHLAEELIQLDIDVKIFPSKHTVYFENIYAADPDQRTQRVLQIADPFTIVQFQDIDASVFHLGPLLAEDISLELIQLLAAKGKVSLDVQGFLRKVENQQVLAIDWKEKLQALPYISILKASEHEAVMLTGEADIRKAAMLLNEWGVKEVVITMGSAGSLIYADEIFYNVNAYTPSQTIDATGCGDTYMAGYLYQRSKDASPQQAGEFASAMASLKIEKAGAFKGTEEEVLAVLMRS